MRLLRTMPDGVMLWQVAAEFIAASRKLEAQGFRSSDAWGRLGDLLARFPLARPSQRTLEIAQPLHVEQGLAFWDAMIIASCIEVGVTTLYSEDVPGAKVEGVHVLNPFAASGT